MKSVLIRLQHHLPSASVAERGVLEFILANPEATAECNIHELSRLSYCSPSTIVRMCRKLGFEGYRDLRRDLLCELAVRRKNTQENADGLTLESTLADPAGEESMVERIALRAAVDALPDQEKKTILLRFFKGLTQQQCARILGVSQVQISRLEKRAIEKLRREMG